MRVLIDANVVLDVLLARQPWLTEATAVWAANTAGRIRGCLCATALTNVCYISRRQIGAASARFAIEKCLQAFDIIPVDRPVLLAAQAMAGTDFEDNVLCACAAAARLDAIVTRDPKGFAGCTVPALSPADLLARLTPAAAPP